MSAQHQRAITLMRRLAQGCQAGLDELDDVHQEEIRSELDAIWPSLSQEQDWILRIYSGRLHDDLTADPPDAVPGSFSQWQMLRELRGEPFGNLNLLGEPPWRQAVAAALVKRGLAKFEDYEISPDADPNIYITGGWDLEFVALRDPQDDCICCRGGGYCEILGWSRLEDCVGWVRGTTKCECRWDLERYFA